MRRLAMVGTIVVGVFAAGTALASPVGAERPPDLVCGQVITTDVVLRTDLTCTGDGLIIAASGVTVRLGDHTITSSDGTGMGIRFSQPATGDEITCVQDSEVTGGTITGFFAGIGTSFCRSSRPFSLPPDVDRASSVTLSGNTWGVYTTSGYVVGVDRATITGPNGVGGAFSPGAATGTAKVTGSRIRVTSADGFNVLGAIGTRPTVEGSRLEGGRAYVIDSDLTISASRLDGVTVDCSDGQVDIADSRVIGGSVSGFVCGSSISGNHFVGPGDGIALDVTPFSYGMSITDNVFTGWGTAVVTELGATTVTGNTFRGNGNAVTCEASGCNGEVTANRFVDNAGAGVVLRFGMWRVGSNLAMGNGGLGIDAQGAFLRVTDDGGNVARRNLPPQCIGVVCAPHP